MKPAHIGRYEILEELSSGGMSTVYLAFDPEIKRRVAVKILSPQFTVDEAFLYRFRREAQVIAALEHAAIVPIYDVGEYDGRPFLVMRYMAGGSLSDRIATGPMSPVEVSAIVACLAPALDKAHAAGIVHRDLKPANILLDEQGNPYLSDFGLVKLTDDSATSLSISGMVLGTPDYMSPEQVRGDRELDARSDTYSLGVILFAMLAGRLPYRSATPMGVAIMHVTEPVPRILPHRPQLHPMFELIIERAMAKDPAERYPSAGALSTAVSNLVNARTSTVSGVDPSPTEYMSRPGPRALRALDLPARPDLGAVWSRVPPHRRRVLALLIMMAIGAAALFSGWALRNDGVRVGDGIAAAANIAPVVSQRLDQALPQAMPTLRPLPGSTATATPTASATTAVWPSPTLANVVAVGGGQNPLYTGPGPGYLIIRYLTSGDTLVVVARTDDSRWLNVELSSGLRGWVAASAVVAPAGVTPTVPIAMTVPPAPTAAPLATIPFIPLTPTALSAPPPTAPPPPAATSAPPPAPTDPPRPTDTLTPTKKPET